MTDASFSSRLTAGAFRDLCDRVNVHLARINEIGALEEGRGWTRLALTEEETRAHDYAEEVFRSLGAVGWRDAFDNRYGRMERTSGRPFVMLGTHLDTVPSGGRFDGVVGFIVAVEAVRLLLESKARCPNIEFAVFRAEESTRFSRSCLGSQAAFGRLAAKDLRGLKCKVTSGERTLESILTELGRDVGKLGACLLDLSRYSAYLEAHIEQASVLEAEDCLGAVTSIRGAERRAFEFSGELASLASAASIRLVESLAGSMALAGADLVATVGKVDGFFVGADKVNTIPGRVTFPVRGAVEDGARLARFIAAGRRCRASLVAGATGRAIEVTGVADHSGGTPMGRRYRRDALVAACEVLAELGPGVADGAQSIMMTLDVRSNRAETRGAYVERLVPMIRLAGKDFAAEVRVHNPTQSDEPVASLDPELRCMMRRAAEELGLRLLELPSGAGHDAMIAHQAGIPAAMVFVPSRDGLSHNPAEYTETRHIAEAVELTARLLAAIESRNMGGGCQVES